jgi:hypothetical protein
MERRTLIGQYALDSQTPTPIGRSVQFSINRETASDWSICSYTRRDGLIGWSVKVSIHGDTDSGWSVQVPIHGETDSDWLICQVPIQGETDSDWSMCSGPHTRRDGLWLVDLFRFLHRETRTLLVDLLRSYTQTDRLWLVDLFRFLYTERRPLIGWSVQVPIHGETDPIGWSFQIPIQVEMDSDWLIFSGSYTRRNGLWLV